MHVFYFPPPRSFPVPNSIFIIISALSPWKERKKEQHNTAQDPSSAVTPSSSFFLTTFCALPSLLLFFFREEEEKVGMNDSKQMLSISLPKLHGALNVTYLTHFCNWLFMIPVPTNPLFEWVWDGNKEAYREEGRKGEDGIFDLCSRGLRNLKERIRAETKWNMIRRENVHSALL